ncbi:MAG: anti-sigma factor domain-containing protein [Spirosomataceae bacterium]|jgi:anti-sigma-K factor RskA
MNVNEYISSGILEEYVLGVVSDQERREVQCLSKIYPEIELELRKLEESMGSYLGLYAKEPPVSLKNKIFAQMDFSSPLEEVKTTEKEQPVASTPVSTPEVEKEVQVIQFTPTWSKVSVAASVLLAVGLGWAVFNMKQIIETNGQLSNQVNILEKVTDQNGDLLAMYQNPQNKVVRLAGVDKSPESSVVVFWNQQNNEVALIVDNLPKPEAGKQYQLWTIVDGKPVDMGMLDQEFGNKILQMKGAAGNVAAFAITLEKEGGSPVPTLEQMYVVGNV